MKKLPEKLDLIKVKKEMYRLSVDVPMHNRIVEEIVAREINLLENKINAIIDYLKVKEEK